MGLHYKLINIELKKIDFAQMKCWHYRCEFDLARMWCHANSTKMVS